MKQYNWTGDASTLASALESAIRGAMQTQSPSQMMVPIGQGIAEGVGQGMTQVSLAPQAQALANEVSSSLRAAMSPGRFSPIGSS